MRALYFMTGHVVYNLAYTNTLKRQKRSNTVVYKSEFSFTKCNLLTSKNFREIFKAKNIENYSCHCFVDGLDDNIYVSDGFSTQKFEVVSKLETPMHSDYNTAFCYLLGIVKEKCFQMLSSSNRFS